MNRLYLRVWKHCRWCGKAYQASKPTGKDGFCSPKHKQAHHRAYKAYVTHHVATRPGLAAEPVTRKK